MTSQPPVWRSLLRIARTRPVLYATSGLTASVLFYMFPLVPGLILRPLFDRIGREPALDSAAVRLLLLLFAVTTARFAVMVGASVAESSMQTIGRTLLTRNILADVLTRPGARPLPASTGEAIARIRADGSAVVQYLTWVFDPLGQGIVLLLAFAVLFKVSPALTLAIVVPLVVTLAAANLLSRRIRTARLAAQEAIGAVSGLLGETFGSVQAVQLAGAETRVVAHLDELQEQRRRTGLRDVVLMQAIQAFTGNAANIAIGALLIAASRSISRGDFTVGDFALFASYVQWVAVVVSGLGTALTYHRQTGVSLRRLLELLPGSPPRALTASADLHLRGRMPSPPVVSKTPDDRLERFELRGLTCLHTGAGGVESVDLVVDRGEIVVITGEVGSGKSTLLRAMLGLLPSDAGEIWWNGSRVGDPASFCVPPRCAYTPQVPRLFSGTLRDNILLGHHGGDVDGALRSAVLEDDVAGLPDGLDTKVGARGVRLSGGQLLRTAAARMFVREPELAVFDDLSSALDVETESMLWQRTLAQPRDERPAMVVVSHRRAALRLADKIVLLEGGRVSAVGTLAELLALSELMRTLWAHEVESG